MGVVPTQSKRLSSNQPATKPFRLASRATFPEREGALCCYDAPKTNLYTNSTRIVKKILQPILLTIVALGIGAFVWGKISPDPAVTTASTDPSAAAAESAAAEPNEQPSVVVTYFTTDVRCVSCKTIERLTRESLEHDFAGPLKSGQLRFQTINIDRAENKHYITDYDLSFKTVVVARAAPNTDAAAKWEKLDDVWTLLSTPDEFAAYIHVAVAEKLAPKA